MTHRLSKLPDDYDPWAPNNLLTPEQKKNTSWTPVGQATDKNLALSHVPKCPHLKASLTQHYSWKSIHGVYDNV